MEPMRFFPKPQNPKETRVIAAAPRARLARLPEADRQLVMLLVSLGAEQARTLLAGLSDERRELLAPLVAEAMSLPDAERHALFAVPERRTDSSKLNARLRTERPRLANLLVHELAPRRAPANLVPAKASSETFGRTLAAIARSWKAEATK
ncbi:MAG: hypothetical protein JST54_11820 [Deltaproteobacteria bacterium]|nr:hypothetical protein [Deltaproteobacteria bacterium]